MSNSLFVYTAHDQTLPAAVAAFQKTLTDDGATALFYAPARCILAKVAQDGSATDSSGHPVTLNDVFEARVFHRNAELRWLNDPSAQRQHRTAILSVRKLDVALTEASLPGTVVGTLEQTYLLWGTGDTRTAGLASGWSRLATPRIGKLDVPLAGVNAEQRVVVRAIEYLCEFADGNVAVAEERLVGLEAGGATCLKGN
jgi:CRISPR-associated protein (TIGR03984 family)